MKGVTKEYHHWTLIHKRLFLNSFAMFDTCHWNVFFFKIEIFYCYYINTLYTLSNITFATLHDRNSKYNARHFWNNISQIPLRSLFSLERNIAELCYKSFFFLSFEEINNYLEFFASIAVEWQWNYVDQTFEDEHFTAIFRCNYTSAAHG